MPYPVGLLQPSRIARADARNAPWLGPLTLGIEVTEPVLASQCGLGHIDPQHEAKETNRAAIDVACEWPLPPPGARLVTIRPDADACGSMAVLRLRAAGHGLSSIARIRISLISRSDRNAVGAWPGPRPLPTCVEDVDEVGLGPQELGALKSGICLPETTIESAVACTGEWICSGLVPHAWRQHAAHAADVLLKSFQEKHVTARLVVPGRVAVVEGYAPGALSLGYRLAPVVVAVAILRSGRSGENLRKISIGQYHEGYVDLVRAARLLSQHEPGWGGSATIIGSPQGISTDTTVDKCIDVLSNHCM